MQADTPGRWSSTAAGFGLGVLLHLVFGGLLVALAQVTRRSGEYIGTFDAAWILIGLVQLVYLGPAAYLCWRGGRRHLVRGLVLVAALTFLLNAGCWGIVLL